MTGISRDRGKVALCHLRWKGVVYVRKITNTSTVKS